MNSRKCAQRLAVVLFGLAAVFPGRSALAQDAPADGAPPRRVPPAAYLTVRGSVDDQQVANVRNVAMELQTEAAERGQPAILVLEITPGTSQFHQVWGLARFLTSPEIAQVRTVAWVPETVTGHNVVLALACREIVMHPEAQLGDIGRGRPLDADDRQAVLNLVERRHNRQVTPALAQGLMDPQQAVFRVTIQRGAGAEQATEARVVTRDELERLREERDVVIPDAPVTIKEAGVPGLLKGSRARTLDVLVSQTAEGQSDLERLYNLPPQALRKRLSSDDAVDVRLIQIDGVISPVLESFLDRQIDRAIAAGANLLIFEIDSPGGYLQQSLNLADKISALSERKVRTVAYIPDMALSGAAIIALGCDEIYMHSKATIGSAAPIEAREGGPFERAPEKVLSVLRVKMERLAQDKGRPSALAVAMADRNLQVFEVEDKETGRIWYMSEHQIQKEGGRWIQGPLVPETADELLLTVNGDRAHELKLAQRPVEDFDELKMRLGIAPGERILPLGRTWVDTLVFVLNTREALFLIVVVGFICLFIELHFMTGLLGIISALCFSIFFWSRFMGGTAGWLEVVLFVLGVVCIGLEIFVIPGFGVFGVSGGLLILASLIMASQTFTLETGRNIDEMARTMATLSAAIVSVIVLAAVINRYLPRMPLLSRMILAPPGAETSDPDEPRLRPEVAGESLPGMQPLPAVPGARGTAVTTLRPAGKAQIGDEYVDVVSEGSFIQAGAEIEVVEAQGNRIVVRQA